MSDQLTTIQQDLRRMADIQVASVSKLSREAADRLDTYETMLKTVISDGLYDALTSRHTTNGA